MSLLGSNKKMTTQRLSNNTYSDFLTNIGMRYEPLPKRNPPGYIIRADHISFQVMVHTIDLKATDRVIVDNRTFVTAGLAKLDDAMGKHLEVVIREVNSQFHQTVTKKVLQQSQPTYDPIFKEYQPGTSKAYAEVSMSVLLDQAQDAKQRYKMLLDAGKFNDIEWMMTIDIPDTINTDDRILYNGKLYKVMWVENLIWEIVAGLQTDVDNMPTNA